MSQDANIIRRDYDLGALESVRPRDHDFEMVVTPRLVEQYAADTYKPLTSNLIRAIAGRKRVFIDVGAHYGFFSIIAGRSNPELQIHAIEPVRENLLVLQRNLELNGLASAVCHEAAASNRTERARLCKAQASDASGLYPHPAAPPLAETEVQTLELATLLEDRTGAPTLIKIDTNGHEIPVLEGLADALSGNEDPTLILAINPQMQRRAGHNPADLLLQLERMGLSSFLIQESGPRLVRVDSTSDWLGLIPQNETSNLYCRPRDTAMSICFMAHSHGLAGAERAMADLVTQLIEDHGTVCNVVIPGDGPLRQRIERAGAGVIPADYGWWCSSEPKAPDAITKALGDDLVRLLARTLPEVEVVRPDLISSSSIVIPHGAILATAVDKPHVWHLREYGSDYTFFLPSDERLRFIEDFSDAIFTASKRLGETLFPHLQRDRIDHLYPSIQVPEQVSSTRDLPTTETDRPLLLVDLASIFEAKQQEIDIRAVAELSKRGHRVELLLKGPQDPLYVQRLQELADSLGISEQITFEEFSVDVWPTIARADALLISAPAHCFGRVAAEGMLGAKPVIYPASTDISEYMTDGVTGLAYAASNAQDMAEKVEQLVQDPALREAMGKAARNRAVELFTRRGFADKFIERARKLTDEGPAIRPSLPALFVDSLTLGIQRLDRHSLELEKRVVARDGELAAARTTLASRETEIAALKAAIALKDEELGSIKPVLADKQEELESIKPVLAARDVELVNVKAELDGIRDKLDRLLSTRFGRWAASLAKVE
jgi:FkbM family methyltransferase